VVSELSGKVSTGRINLNQDTVHAWQYNGSNKILEKSQLWKMCRDIMVPEDWS